MNSSLSFRWLVMPNSKFKIANAKPSKSLIQVKTQFRKYQVP